MDYCAQFTEYVDVTPSQFKRHDINQGLSPRSSPTQEMLVDTPRIPVYPARFHSRFFHRGRSARKRRARYMQFNRCSPSFNRQYRPRGFNRYYDIYQDCCPDQYEHSGQRKNKLAIEYFGDPSFCEEQQDDFSRNGYPLKSSDWGMAPERRDHFRDQERISRGHSIFETQDSMEKLQGFISLESPFQTPEIDSNCRDGTFKTKINSVNRKRKRQNIFESSVDRNTFQEICDVSGTVKAANFTPDTTACFSFQKVRENSTPTCETTKSLETEKFENGVKQISNEAALAVQNLQSTYPETSLNCGNPHVPPTEASGNNTVTSSDEQSTTLNLDSEEVNDAYTMLNNIMSEMVQPESFENGNIPENKAADLSQTENYQMLTFSDFNNNETDSKASDSPFASLIQQNQILTDLLSKLISGSSIFKENNENQIPNKNTQPPESETFFAQNSASHQITNTATIPTDNAFILSSGTLIQSPNENSFPSTAEDNIQKSVIDDSGCIDIPPKNNEMSVAHFTDLETSKSANKDACKYQLHILESENDFSYLDFVNTESFPGVEASLNSLTNYILEEPTLNSSSAVLEKTTEKIIELRNEAHTKEGSQNKKDVKTVVRKATVRRRTLSRTKTSIGGDQKEVLHQCTITNQNVDAMSEKCCKCESQINCKSSCDVQTQTEEITGTIRDLQNESVTHGKKAVTPCNCSQTRRLRSSTSKKQQNSIAQEKEVIPKSSIFTSNEVSSHDTSVMDMGNDIELSNSPTKIPDGKCERRRTPSSADSLSNKSQELRQCRKKCNESCKEIGELCPGHKSSSKKCRTDSIESNSPSRRRRVSRK